ncbi:DUF6207 family protein [Streptomyces sp. NPDC093108]|uniref:DUF6207 family protein n=1 Tax=Streptomyces sp. NPDC093108 TaxID=3366030 RepID=UPI00381755F6
MENIATAHLSRPGTGYVEIVAHDAPTVRRIAAQLAGTWTSSGVPVVRQVGHLPGQAAYTGRLYLATLLPAPGTPRVLPADWVRLSTPPWGGRTDPRKPPCVRRRKGGQPCTRQAAEWPEGFGEADPGACWSHLSDEERKESLRVRKAYTAAFWAMKERHREEVGHGRDDRCDGCAPVYGQVPSPY